MALGHVHSRFFFYYMLLQHYGRRLTCWLPCCYRLPPGSPFPLPLHQPSSFRTQGWTSKLLCAGAAKVIFMAPLLHVPSLLSCVQLKTNCSKVMSSLVRHDHLQAPCWLVDTLWRAASLRAADQHSSLLSAPALSAACRGSTSRLPLPQASGTIDQRCVATS